MTGKHWAARPFERSKKLRPHALHMRTGAGCIVSMLTLVEQLTADVQFQPIGHVFLYREVPAAQIGVISIILH
jgi:hypothetical protein